ncbi:MAG: glutaredoxin domain-containing protein [Patescibacteria group bacterium]
MDTPTATTTQKHITVYSTPTCTYCHHLKDYLTEKGFAYEDINVAADISKLQEAVLKSGQKGVPVIDIDGTIIVGFDQEEVDKALGITN